jgi:hypothetical protein
VSQQIDQRSIDYQWNNTGVVMKTMIAINTHKRSSLCTPMRVRSTTLRFDQPCFRVSSTARATRELLMPRFSHRARLAILPQMSRSGRIHGRYQVPAEVSQTLQRPHLLPPTWPPAPASRTHAGRTMAYEPSNSLLRLTIRSRPDSESESRTLRRASTASSHRRAACPRRRLHLRPRSRV